MNIPGWPLKALDLPLARELAEFKLLQYDLHNSLAALKLWLARYEPADKASNDTTVMLDSLFRDAIVQFVSCFLQGKNKHALAVADVYVGDVGADAYMTWLIDLRNSYAAHRYGVARQCVAGVVINPSTSEFAGIGFLQMTFAGLSESEHADLIRYVSKACAFVDRRVEQLSAEFENAARKLSPEELEALPMAKGYGYDPDELGLSRGKLLTKRDAMPSNQGGGDSQ